VPVETSSDAMSRTTSILGVFVALVVSVVLI
jgi:hypothetical protein